MQVASRQALSLRRTVSRLIGLFGLVAVASLFAKFLSMWLKMRRNRRMLADVPLADFSHHPYLGHVPSIIANMHRRNDFYVDGTLGKPVSWTYGMFFDPYSVEIFVNDASGIKHFLKDNFNNYSKGPSHRDAFFFYLRQWLGEGIFTARHGPDAEDGGQNWMRQRKVAASIFTRSNFNNNMNEVFVAKGRHFCDLLEAPAKEGTPVDMQLQFFSYTMDSIMQIFFNEASDTLGGQSNKYATAFDTAHRNLIEFVLTNISSISVGRLLPWPIGGNTGILMRGITARDKCHKRFREANGILDSESRRIVNSARGDPKLSDRKDLLALFLQSETQERFTDEWLRDIVLNMIIAGRDTTACTLSWMFYILATHPEIQEKVCQEVDESLPSDGQIDFKAVGHAELPYLHGVLFETLRLYPPVPADMKEAVADDVLPDGTPIPRHTKVNWVPYVLGRDPERYPEPMAVRPERWIPFKDPPPHEFPVFQAGPRLCLGMNMAIFEAKIAAGMLLRDYTFEISPNEAEKITYIPVSLTMSICNSKKQDSHNLWLTPKRRPTR